MLRKPCVLPALAIPPTLWEPSERRPSRKCSAKTLLTLRKYFNANNLISRTVEDGSEATSLRLRIRQITIAIEKRRLSPVISDRTFCAGKPKKRPFLGMSECRYRFPRLVSDTETLCEALVQRPYIRETLYRSLSRRRE